MMKSVDTCHQCGALVNLSDGKTNCPECGAKMKLPQIPLDLGEKIEKKDKKQSENVCPHCMKKIMDETSLFCPYCGKSVDESEIPNNLDELIDKTSVAKEFMDLDTSSELIKFYVPDNLQYAIFNCFELYKDVSSQVKIN